MQSAVHVKKAKRADPCLRVWLFIPNPSLGSGEDVKVLYEQREGRPAASQCRDYILIHQASAASGYTKTHTHRATEGLGKTSGLNTFVILWQHSHTSRLARVAHSKKQPWDQGERRKEPKTLSCTSWR